jgi:acyl carrier protein
MAEEGNLEKGIKEVIAENLGINPDEIQNNSTLDSLGADSLDIVEIVMALEDKYRIKIPDDEAEKLTNFDSFVNYIREHRPKDY